MNPIGWCDKTINYVRGCNNSCSYCYARRFNKRTWEKMFDIEWNYRWENDIGNTGKQLTGLEDKMKNFKPVFMYSQFAKLLPKRPMRIFMDSMSDICFWENSWIKKALEKIKEYPQHQFLFLTKQSDVYLKYDYPKNCWLGVTIINNNVDDQVRWMVCNDLENKMFISIEPIQENIDQNILSFFDWVIIGVESGNRKNKIIPELGWIENIRQYCYDKNIPYYEKDNLRNVLNRELIKEFPAWN
jgi:protein gp37